MSKKKKIIYLILSVLCLAGLIVSVGFSVKTDNEKTKYSKVYLNKLYEKQVVENEYAEKYKGVPSTADEISRLKREVEEAKRKNSIADSELRQFIIEYINLRYGSGESKDKLISSLEEYVDHDYLYNQVTRYLNAGAGNMGNKSTNNKADKPLCSKEDIYLTIEEYDDGSDVYLAVCAIHFSENNTVYHDITLAEDNSGKVKVVHDDFLNAARVNF